MVVYRGVMDFDSLCERGSIRHGHRIRVIAGNVRENEEYVFVVSGDHYGLHPIGEGVDETDPEIFGVIDALTVLLNRVWFFESPYYKQ